MRWSLVTNTTRTAFFYASKKMENMMIEVKNELIGKELVQAVNARDLWAKLESKQDFSTWIKKRVADYGFVENQDFTRFHKKKEANNATMTEYVIALDMAKELAMMEKTEQGRVARRYFIECEKQLHSSSRHIDAIRSLLLLDAPATWEKLYPDSFFIEIMNLHGHTFDGNKSTPAYCSRIIRNWVYDIVLPEQLNFEIDTKRGLEKKHQWFQNENGRQTLSVQIGKVEMIARMSESRADFEANCARAFLGSPLQLSIKS